MISYNAINALILASPMFPHYKRSRAKTGTSDVSLQQLCERWGISLKAATTTLRKTTQRFLRSVILPLSRRYRTDMMFERKTLRGQWSTDTMDGRCKSLDGNRYAQVFANKSYFSRKLFLPRIWSFQTLTFDGSKEQTKKGPNL